MKNIITIQHTQSVQHINGMIGSWSDWDLTKLGIEQAKQIGECLFDEIKNERYVMYSSDLLRVKHTAEIVKCAVWPKTIDWAETIDGKSTLCIYDDILSLSK